MRISYVSLPLRLSQLTALRILQQPEKAMQAQAGAGFSQHLKQAEQAAGREATTTRQRQG